MFCHPHNVRVGHGNRHAVACLKGLGDGKLWLGCDGGAELWSSRCSGGRRQQRTGMLVTFHRDEDENDDNNDNNDKDKDEEETESGCEEKRPESLFSSSLSELEARRKEKEVEDASDAHTSTPSGLDRILKSIFSFGRGDDGKEGTVDGDSVCNETHRRGCRRGRCQGGASTVSTKGTTTTDSSSSSASSSSSSSSSPSPSSTPSSSLSSSSQSSSARCRIIFNHSRRTERWLRRRRDRTGIMLSSSLSSSSSSRRGRGRGRRSRDGWRSAVDPASGRVYYYDARTRTTQWEKPAELVSAKESHEHCRKARRDRAFFREMEENIRRSLARGEAVPGQGPLREDGDETKGMPAKSPTSVVAALVAGVDEMNCRPKVALVPSLENRSLPMSCPSSASASCSKNVAEKLCGDAGAANVRPLRRNEATLTNANPKKKAHVRHNTGGTLYVDSHLFRPDVDATIWCVCRLYLDLILEGTTAAATASASSASTSHSSAKSRPSADCVRAFNDGYGDGKCSFSSTAGSAPSSGFALLPSPRSHWAMMKRIAQASAGLLESLSGGGGGSSSALSTESSSPSPEDSDAPDETSPPSLDEVTCFFTEFFRRAKMEPDAVVISFLYAERLAYRAGIFPSASSWRSVLLSCMCLASKVWDDLSMWNSDFAQVCRRGTCGGPPPLSSSCLSRRRRVGGRRWARSGGNHTSRALRRDGERGVEDDLGLSSFTLARINLLERTLLHCLDYDASVSASAYAALYFRVRAMSIGGNHDDYNDDEEEEDGCDDHDDEEMNHLTEYVAETGKRRVRFAASAASAVSAVSVLDAEGARGLGVYNNSPPSDKDEAGGGRPRSRRCKSLCDYGTLAPALLGDGGALAATKKSVCLERVVSMR